MANNSVKLDLLFPDTHNLQLLGIMDLSFYPSNFTISTPTIEITPPGFSKAVLPFSTRSLNIFNSNNLDITCIDGDCNPYDLPDGIWYIKYTIAPATSYFVEKTFIRVESLKNLFGKVFLNTSLNECEELAKEQDMEKIDEISALINGAVADANKCNNISAMKKYSAAHKLITNFLKTK